MVVRIKDIDAHLGKRLRCRRRLVGLTQSQVAGTVGVRFQQIQKYECGANRISASRLYQLAEALEVPISYFFEELPAEKTALTLSNKEGDDDTMLGQDTLELIRVYDALDKRFQRLLLELAKSLNGEFDADAS